PRLPEPQDVLGYVEVVSDLADRTERIRRLVQMPAPLSALTRCGHSHQRPAGLFAKVRIEGPRVSISYSSGLYLKFRSIAPAGWSPMPNSARDHSLIQPCRSGRSRPFLLRNDVFGGKCPVPEPSGPGAHRSRSRAVRSVVL